MLFLSPLLIITGPHRFIWQLKKGYKHIVFLRLYINNYPCVKALRVQINSSTVSTRCKLHSCQRTIFLQCAHGSSSTRVYSTTAVCTGVLKYDVRL